MALRDFTDRSGVLWKAWDITPESVHPVTRLEDYMQGFTDGWLVFESVDTGEKRRLCPIPTNWAELDDMALADLCATAEPVRTTRRQPVSRQSAEVAQEMPNQRLVRTFAYPGGRVWSVTEVLVQYRDSRGEPVGDPRLVLRFTSGVRVLDLLAWPADWASYSDEELTNLMWKAFPRERGKANVTSHHRRRGDPLPAG